MVGGKQQLKRTPSDDGCFGEKDSNFDSSHLSDDGMEAESMETSSLDEGKRSYLYSIKSDAFASANCENYSQSISSFTRKAEVPAPFPNELFKNELFDGAVIPAQGPKFLENMAKETAAQEILDFEKVATIFDRAERTQLVSQVARKLQDYGHLNVPDRSTSKTFQVNNKQQKQLAAAPVTPPTSSVITFHDALSYTTSVYGNELKNPDVPHGHKYSKPTLVINTGAANPLKYNIVNDGEDTSVECEGPVLLLSSPNDATSKVDCQGKLDLHASSVVSPRSDDVIGNDLKPSSQEPTTLTSTLNDPVMVAVVHQKILRSTIYDNEDEASTSAAICRLLMSTDPKDSDLGKKVTILMNKYSVVEREFKRYCVALFPHIYPPSYSKSSAKQLNLPFLSVKAPDKVSRCGHAEFDRMFTSFALNYMEGLLRCASNSRAITLDEKEKAALKQSAETWFGSVVASH